MSEPINNKNFHVLLLGSNEYRDESLRRLSYSEKDCKDLYEVFTHSDYCNVPSENIKSLLGQQLTIDGLQKALYQTAVRERTNQDVLIVYYSGHGFQLKDVGKTYLATHDLQKSYLSDNPYAGIALDQFYDAFQESNAGYVIFIIDACYSASMIPKGSDDSTDQEEVGDITYDENFKGFEKRFSKKQGRVILASSARDGKSFQSNKFENSVFTHFLIKGLKGEAADSNADITILSLLNFLSKNVPSYQMPEFNLSGNSPLILSKLKVKQAEKQEPNEKFHIQHRHLKNPLDGYDLKIKDYVNYYESSKKTTPAIKAFLAATTLFTKSIAKLVKFTPEALTPFDENPISLDSVVAEAIIHELTERPLNPGRTFNIRVESEEREVIMLNSTDFLILKLKEDSFFNPEEALIQTIIGFYEVINENPAATSDMIEGQIFDHLKIVFNSFPQRLFEKRIELFNKRLESMTMVFQPIVYLDKHFTHIESFEALARDPVTERAPVDLFRAAELWDHELKLKLDLFFLQKAITLYREKLETTTGFRRMSDWLELGINVYPSSLTNMTYFAKLRELTLDKNLMHANKIVLEISEKQDLPQDLDAFRKTLQNYVRNFGITFAIDDYGVANGTMHRLQHLRPTYVKVDRAILQTKLSVQAIIGVKATVDTLISEENLSGAKLVFEGYDDEIAKTVSLKEIYDSGVRHLQGNFFSRPIPDLIRLPKETQELASRLINATD